MNEWQVEFFYETDNAIKIIYLFRWKYGKEFDYEIKTKP